MSPRQLPEHPSLEQLKKQATSLLNAARDGDRAALDRFVILPAFSGHADRVDAVALALHDAQSVVAREHGFASWTLLREEVEARTLSLDAAVDAFIRAATGGASGRAKRLLALHPPIGTANFHTALVLGDATSVEARLRARPQLATERGGPQNWTPLLYVCHTCLHRDTEPAPTDLVATMVSAGRAEGLVAIARRLLALGANPNDEYHWNWHPELPRTVLWGALITMGHVPLAQLLLESGANPTDGVTAHIAGGSGNIAALDLLHRFGMNVNGIAGGVPPLVYILIFAEDASGPRWLLEHGADPNLAWGPDDEAPLHVAARRWDRDMIELLVRHGADPMRRRADGYTPHTLAEVYGNHDSASWLLGHGATDQLSALERFIAACARADGSAADAMLRAHPGLAGELRQAHHLMLHRPAETGDALVLETMLARGFDPSVKDKDGVTPLHRAAMGGHPEAVKTLLRFGAPKDALDGMFAAPPMVWAVEGRGHAQPGTDHVAVAQLLIDAGSPVDWTPPPGAPGPERTLEGLSDLKRAASLPAR
jgi:Ankyrin repeats (3 copies)/Ankyrin repeats (many copies)